MEPSRTAAVRFAREPRRGLESRFRYYAHAFPRGVWAGSFVLFLLAWWGLGPLPGALVFLAYWQLRARAHRPFDLLAEERVGEAEAAALEDLSGELPGPVADEYLTVAAIGRAMAGDRVGARELLARRQAPVRELAALLPDVHRPLGAAALEAVGDPESALDVLGAPDPDRGDPELVVMRAGLLAAARRYDEARLVLARLRARALPEDPARTAIGVGVAVARETWDPDLETMLDEFSPRDGREEAIALSARAFLGEVKGHPEEAHAFGRRLFELRLAQAGLEGSPGLHRLRDELESTLLRLDRMDPESLAIARTRLRDLALGAGAEARGVLEVRWLEACIELAWGWMTREERAARLEGASGEVLDAAGAFLRSARALWLIETRRPDDAAAAVDLALRAGRDAPPARVADALLRQLRGQPLDEVHQDALHRARYALRVYPSPLRPMLEAGLVRAGA